MISELISTIGITSPAWVITFVIIVRMRKIRVRRNSLDIDLGGIE